MFFDIVIVGGGPAGVITATTAKSVYPDKTVCVIKHIGDGVIPCAIPYMMNTLDDPSKNVMPDTPLEKAGVSVFVDQALELKPEDKKLHLISGKEVSYDKLVLATGAQPVMPPIPGVEKSGVFTIRKSLADMRNLREMARQAKSLVIIGGGFIGVEFADELAQNNDLKIHLVEMLPSLLGTAFDDEFCDDIQSILTKNGVNVLTNSAVKSIEGKDRVEEVVLVDGKRLEADLVLLSAGAKPANEMAARAGLKLTDNGSIWVDEYMRSSRADVFSVGDCAVKRDFFTRREVPVWLASTATAEARIAGTNLYKIRVLRQIQGTISAFSTQIGDVAFGSAGLTRNYCEKEGFCCVSATAEAPDRHPGMLPGARSMRVKLTFSARSGILLGGQVSGGSSVGELINVIALAIQKKMTVREMDMMQIATHPLLTSAPTVHPLIIAAHQVLAKFREIAPAVY